MDKSVVSVTGVAASSAIKVLNHNPVHIGFGVIVSGTVTYTVQHSFDGGTNWFDHEFVVGQTVAADGNYAYPVSDIRLNVTAGTGTATLTTIQA